MVCYSSLIITLFWCNLLSFVELRFLSLEWNTKTDGTLMDYWFNFVVRSFHWTSASSSCTVSSLLYTCSPLFSPLILHPLLLLDSSLLPLPFLLFNPSVARWCFFFVGVMIACYVVSQLWVIRSNIISKAINGRQYSCVFYSFFLFLFFHFSQNILTSLLFILTGSSLITFRETSLLGIGENK